MGHKNAQILYQQDTSTFEKTKSSFRAGKKLNTLDKSKRNLISNMVKVNNRVLDDFDNMIKLKISFENLIIIISNYLNNYRNITELEMSVIIYRLGSLFKKSVSGNPNFHNDYISLIEFVKKYLLLNDSIIKVKRTSQMFANFAHGFQNFNDKTFDDSPLKILENNLQSIDGLFTTKSLGYSFYGLRNFDIIPDSINKYLHDNVIQVPISYDSLFVGLICKGLPNNSIYNENILAIMYDSIKNKSIFSTNLYHYILVFQGLFNSYNLRYGKLIVDKLFDQLSGSRIKNIENSLLVSMYFIYSAYMHFYQLDFDLPFGLQESYFRYISNHRISSNNSENKAQKILLRYLKRSQIKTDYFVDGIQMDLYIPGKSLNIEIDGAYHLISNSRTNLRDDYLESKYGIRTIRINTMDINYNEKIRNLMKS